MSQDHTADMWVRVSELRERQKSIEVARAQATMADALSALDELQARRDAALEHVRSRLNGPMSPADLGLLSLALQTETASVLSARTRVDVAAESLQTAVDAHTQSTTQRMVAERYRAKRRLARLKEMDRKEDREASDRAGRG